MSSSGDGTVDMPSSPCDGVLSFRGEDTRSKTFVDDLYQALDDKGIRTFKDYEEIQEGEGISDDVKTAIEDSKFHIIVFSKNYASSPRCLEELVKIMECHKMPGHTAYAVFYDVKEAADLDRLELNTLDEIFFLHTNRHEDKFIKTIVQKISLALYSPVLNKLVEALFAVKVDLTPGSAFSFIITCLLAFAGLKSQSVTGFPFKTHPNAIMVPVTSLLIYAFASMAELVVSVVGLDHTSVYAMIARLGRISSLCLFVTSLAILIFI